MNTKPPASEMRVPALTVCQPWGWAIIHGPKRWENRVWQTAYRGPLVIHAGISLAWMDQGAAFLAGQNLALPDRLTFGAALGLVDLVDCVPVAETAGDPFASGPWCWRLENPRPLRRPLPMSGRQKLWNLQLAGSADYVELARLLRSGE
jgi:hypothetical protein